MEDDDVVNAVQELWAEVLLELLLNLGFHPIVSSVVFVFSNVAQHDAL